MKYLSKIKQYNDPALHTICDDINDTDDIVDIINSMKSELALHKNGVGLAAPQIGILKRAIIIKPNPLKNNILEMINPVIYDTGDKTETKIEGCLSYPNTYAKIKRHTFIRVLWKDINKIEHKKYFLDWEARIIQHEIDHLNGICLVGEAWKQNSEI